MPYRTLILLLAVLMLTLAPSCSSDDEEEAGPGPKPPPSGPTVSEAQIVVPSDALPPDLPIQQANNNLDVIRHQGLVFLAFRTAPDHFASSEPVIHVVSSIDQQSWQFETSFHLGLDLREPRLLSFEDRLFLYFAVLGNNPLDFRPGGIMVSEYMGPGAWTPPEDCYLPGFIAWRTKTVDGVPYMMGYIGGEGIYDPDPEPLEVHWLTTDDGRDWFPVVPGQPVVLAGGGSEADFVLLDDGVLIAVNRNEMGDETGFGMKICRAEPQSPGQWNCRNDPKKYDSPLMFRHQDRVFLIGRRNLTATGNYDLGYDHLSMFMQRLLYEALYWFFPKRCSLWEIDPDTLEVDFVLDLPSKGDTCFPAMIREGTGAYTVYNYTSPLDGLDLFWLEGQLGPTWIVRTELTLP